MLTVILDDKDTYECYVLCISLYVLNLFKK